MKPESKALALHVKQKKLYTCLLIVMKKIYVEFVAKGSIKGEKNYIE